VPRVRTWQRERASLSTLREWAWRAPRDAELQFLIGRREIAAGNPAAAATALKAAADLAPGRPHYRLEFARALRLGGADAAAFEQLQRVAKEAPQIAEAHFVIGMLLLEHGRTREAEAPLLEATKRAPRDADSWYALGRCLAEIRQEPRAEAAYRTALAINPRFAGALLGLGELLFRLGRDAEAAALLEEARRITPEDVEILRVLGSVKSRMARTDAEASDAEALLRDATTRAPQSAAAHLALGTHLLRRGERAAAALELRAAAALNPGNTQTLFALGRALRLAGRDKEAQAVLAQFERRNDYERQGRHLSMRIDRMPENADLHFRLGDLHAAHGDRRRAAFEYERGLKLRPGDPAARRKLAAVKSRL
jgi:tetratricopeptide (TPR) repeat protein